MAPPSLTILVPTNDRPEVLERVWPSWLLQEGLSQVVVVDDGSTRDYTAVFTEIEAAGRARGIDVRVLRLAGRRGAPAARNAGLPLCTGDEVFTVDDDIILTPSVVAKCRDSRPAGQGRAILGPRVVYLKDDETQEEADERSRRDTRAYVDMRTLTLVPWVSPPSVERVPFVTAVALWPRSLFADGLRYFEGYRGNGYREETDPQIEAQRSFGAAVFFVPTAEVFHLPPSIAYARKSGQRRFGVVRFEWHVARNNARFLARYGEFLKQRFAVRPWRSWAALLVARLSPNRARALFQQRRGTGVGRLPICRDDTRRLGRP